MYGKIKEKNTVLTKTIKGGHYDKAYLHNLFPLELE